MNIERTSGLKIPKTHPGYEDIVRNLNRFVEDWNGGGTLTNLVFYEEYPDHILIPRYYELPNRE